MSYKAESLRQNFFPRNEVVGWTQGPHGSSRPVTGVVIGREMRGIVSGDQGDMRFRIQTYVKPHGNNYPLSLIRNSVEHNGLSGFEFEITQDLSPEFALGLDYSQTTPVSIPEQKMEDVSLFLIPLVAELPYLFHLPDTGQGAIIKESEAPVSFL